MLARLVGGDAHGAAEGLQRDADVIAERGIAAVAQVEVADIGIGEVRGQQAETRDQARPAPLQRAQLEHLDLEHVARLCALDKDRTRQRVETVEVQARQCRGGCARLDLSIRDLVGLEMDYVAGLDLDRRPKTVVPLVVDLAPLDRMLHANHASHLLRLTIARASTQLHVQRGRPHLI